MPIEALLVGVAAILIGLSFCLAGYPLFLILLPIWAFLYGLIGLGGASAEALGGGFLATGIAIGLGIAFGAFMAVLAYAFWWAGVIVFGATLGYIVGSGVLTAIGIEPGLLTLVAGLASAAVLGVLFVIYRMPRVVVVALTAAGGAVTAVAGALVVFNIVSIQTFKAGPLAAVTNQGWLSAAAVIALAVVGFVVQLRVAKDTEVQIWRRTVGDDEA